MSDRFLPNASSTTISSLSHDDIEVEILLKEYEMLRAEVVARVGIQTQLSTVAITLTAGILAATPFIVFDSSGSLALRVPSEYLFTGLLILSAVFTSILWAFMEQDLEMALIGQYINVSIRPRAIEILHISQMSAAILNWDLFWSRERYIQLGRMVRLLVSLASILFAISRYGLLVIPSAIAVIGAVLVYKVNFLLSPQNGVDWFNLGLFTLTLLYFLGAIFSGVYVGEMYRRIIPASSGHR